MLKQIDQVQIGKRLVRLRGELTQQAVADKIGVAVSSIGAYERGEIAPSDKVKIALADLYGKTVQEIFFD